MNEMAKNPERTFTEADLYPPVYRYLTEAGYTVRSEVKNCDVTAVRGDELVLIELKRSFTLPLVIQAVKRQRVADSVYVAIPFPKRGKFSRSWRDMCHLLRRLELGLIVVRFPEAVGSAGSRRSGAGRNETDAAFSGKDPGAGGPAEPEAGIGPECGPYVEVCLHPEPLERRRNRALRRSILREIDGRSGDYNTGGTTGRKLVTAYRENAIHVACCLAKYGPMSPAEIRAHGTGEKTLAILTANHYGWFERVDRGVYALSGRGAAELERYPELARSYREKLEAHASGEPEREAEAPSAADPAPTVKNRGRKPHAPRRTDR
jgi:hypothetical protein